MVMSCKKNIYPKSVNRCFVVLILLCFFSCKSKVVDDGIEPIQILNVDNPLSVSLQDIVDSVAYIPLETTPECLIGEIGCIKRDDNFYFVKDRNGLYVFDENGHYLNMIGRKGNGPGEYVFMDNFFLDRDNDHVYVIANYMKKVLRYSYAGEYLGDISLSENDANIASAMMCGDGEMLAYYPIPNDVFKADSQYKLLTEAEGAYTSVSLLPQAPVNSGEASYNFLYCPMDYFEGKCFFLSVMSNVLHVYENGKAVAKYKVDMPDILPSKDFLERHKEDDIFELRKALQENHIGLGLTKIASSEGYLFVTINYMKTLMWDGKEAVLLSDVMDDNFDLYLSDNFASSDENIRYCEAALLYESKDEIMNSGNKGLMEIVNKLKVDDNPVICRNYFKKNAIEVLKRKLEE